MTQTLTAPIATSQPVPTQRKLTPHDKLIRRVFLLILTWEQPTLLNKSAAGMQDMLIRDPIQWAKDDLPKLYDGIMSMMFNRKAVPEGTEMIPKDEYVSLATELIENAKQFFLEDEPALATVIVREAASRYFFKEAQKWRLAE